MNTTDSNKKVPENAAPLISVAMPVYNGEKYLAEAIESILKQTFSDFELIIINDGSTDNSLQVMRTYQKRDSRIRLVTRENRNLVTTLNEIVDLARGKWFARMDQDDISLPNRFERQLQWLEKTGADLCGTWIQFFGVGDRRIWQTFETDEAIKIDMLFKCPIAHPSVFMKSELIKKIRYNKNWEKAEDYELWVRAAMADWKMTNVQEVLLMYRRHNEQISFATSNKQRKLTNKVQNTYWKYMEKKLFSFSENNCSSSFFKNFNENDSLPNYEFVIENLLHKSNLSLNNIIMKGSSRICFNIILDNPSAASSILKLNKKLGNDFSLITKAQLLMVRLFRLRVGGLMFNLVRNYRFLLGSSNI